MRPHLRALGAALSIAFAASPVPAAEAPANARADVIAALGARAAMRTRASACEGAIGDARSSAALPWVLHHWESRNFAALRQADAFVSALPAADTPAFQAEVDANAARAGAAPVDKASCEALLDQLYDREKRQDPIGRDAAQRLEAAYAATHGGPEALRLQLRHEHLLIGCMRGAFNLGGRDLARARSTCECEVAAVETSATSAEIDAYLAPDTPGNKPAGAQEPPDWMKKAMPKMAACTPG